MLAQPLRRPGSWGVPGAVDDGRCDDSAGPRFQICDQVFEASPLPGGLHEFLALHEFLELQEFLEAIEG